MKRNNAEQIGELIRHYLRQESLESPLNERRLISAWPEVLGPTIASYTRALCAPHFCCFAPGTDDGARVAGAQLESSCGGPGHNEYHIQMSILSSSILSIFSSFNSRTARS